MSVIQHAERNGQSPKGPPISQEYARSSVPGCMDLPNPTPKAWQPGPSFVSSPSVRRKHRVRRVAHAADRRAIHSPARTSQQVESSNGQKMAHSPHPPPARRVLHVHATTSPIEAGCIPDVAVSLLPHPPHVAQTRMPDRTRMPADLQSPSQETAELDAVHCLLLVGPLQHASTPTHVGTRDQHAGHRGTQDGD